MKNWMKYIALCFLLFAILPLVSPTAVQAGLTAEQNNVTVSLQIPEGKTETITSLRFQLRVWAESGSMDTPAFQFDSSIKSMVQDAAVTKQADGSYLMDLILSGKKDQKIFVDSETAKIGSVSLKPTSKEYRLKVEFADTNLKYTDASGLSEVTVSMEQEQPAVVEFTKSSGSDTKPPSVNPPSSSGTQVQAPAAKPVLKLSRKNYTYVMFKWKKISGADGYVIEEYNSKTKKYKAVKTVTNSKVTAFSKKYSYATTHKFRMRAYKLAADGSKVYGTYSASVKITLSPNQVKSFSAKVSGSKVKLSWKKVSGAKGYQIYRSTKKNSNYKLLKTIKKGKTSKANVTYKAGKKYYYKIRAYVTDSKKKRIYGKFSKAKKA